MRVLNVDAVEQNLAALHVVETQQQGDQRGLAGAGVADDRESLAWLDAERDIAKNPVFVGGFGHIAVAEPDVAKFDFAAGRIEAYALRGGIDGDGLVQQLEDALGSGHGGLQDVEFFAEVLNGAEKARGVHREGREHAEAEAAGEHAVAAGPVDQSDRRDAEKFDSGIEERESEDGIAPRQHVVAIAICEFDAGFALAIEQSAPRPCRKCIPGGTR